MHSCLSSCCCLEARRSSSVLLKCLHEEDTSQVPAAPLLHALCCYYSLSLTLLLPRLFMSLLCCATQRTHSLLEDLERTVGAARRNEVPRLVVRHCVHGFAHLGPMHRLLKDAVALGHGPDAERPVVSYKGTSKCEWQCVSSTPSSNDSLSCKQAEVTHRQLRGRAQMRLWRASRRRLGAQSLWQCTRLFISQQQHHGTNARELLQQIVFLR